MQKLFAFLKTDRTVKSATFMVGGHAVANIGAYLYHLFMGRLLLPADYGELQSLISLVNILNVPSVTINTVVAKFVSTYVGKNEREKISSLYYQIRKSLVVFLVIGGGVFFLFSYRKSWREYIVVFFSSFVAYAVSLFLKILFHADRPFLALNNVQALLKEDGYAFPSSHAAFFGALAVAIFLLNKKVGYSFIFFAVVIGFARITAGVHFPIDILGGFVLGGLTSYLVAYFAKNV